MKFNSNTNDTVQIAPTNCYTNNFLPDFGKS